MDPVVVYLIDEIVGAVKAAVGISTGLAATPCSTASLCNIDFNGVA
jgi:hypothetical protein